jgi:hypothetical protein
VAFSCVESFFLYGSLISDPRDNVQQKQWGRQGNAAIQFVATAIGRDAGTKKALFGVCRGSSIPVSVLNFLMDQIILKTFHARAGASMDAWKRKTLSS